MLLGEEAWRDVSYEPNPPSASPVEREARAILSRRAKFIRPQVNEVRRGYIYTLEGIQQIPGGALSDPNLGSDERKMVAALWRDCAGATNRTLGEAMGVTEARARQLVAQGRVLVAKERRRLARLERGPRTEAEGA